MRISSANTVVTAGVPRRQCQCSMLEYVMKAMILIPVAALSLRTDTFELLLYRQTNTMVKSTSIFSGRSFG
jgi:hypothetical protein